MQKTKYTRAIASVKQLGSTAISFTSICAVILLIKLYYFNSQIGSGGRGILYGFASLGSLLIVVSISLLLKTKAKLIFMISFDIFLSIIIFSNLLYYRYFNDLISIPLLTQLKNAAVIESSMYQLLHFSDLLLISDFILFPAVKAVKGKPYAAHTRSVAPYKSALICFSGIIIVLVSFSQLVKSQPTILSSFYDRVYISQSIGLLNYHAADAYMYVKQSLEESAGLEAQKKQEILEYFKSKQQSENSKQLFGAAKEKNLIVIQLEAVQQFVIGKSVNGKEITPNLNKLAESGMYFNNYYYQVAAGGTSDAEFTTNVSMFPMKDGAVYIRKPGNYYYSLPTRLKEEGYSTLALHGYKPGFWNRSAVYKNLGIDKFYSKANLEENELLGMGISDKDFFRQAAEKLKTQKQPYYAFLITLSSHFPYDNDKSKYSSFDVGKYKDTLLGNYLEAVHYADEALGLFVEELRSNGTLENTVLVLYGDHQGIPKDNEKELAEFLGKKDLTSLEWQLQQKVPLIINGPGIEKMNIGEAGGNLDFMPTILNLMGITDSQPSFGRDLLNSDEGFVILRNGSFVTDDMLYISNENTGYDIKTGKELTASEFAINKQEADKLLNYSDTIIKFDLVKEIKEYLRRKN